MALISITRLRLRSWIYVLPFIVQALRIGRQARQADGNLGVNLFNDRRMTFWTATSWVSEDAMRKFMIAAPHGPAMKTLLTWCDEAALVHWTQESATLPSWPEAHARMQRDGRPSKVNHPSADHTAFRIPPPVLGPRSRTPRE